MSSKRVLGKTLEELMLNNKTDDIKGFDFNNQMIDQLYNMRLKMIEMFLEGYQNNHQSDK